MEIFGIGPLEVVLVLVLALIVLGPGKMPEIARQLGKAVREFQRASRELMDALNNEIAEEPKSEAVSGENGRARLPEPRDGAEVLARATPEGQSGGTSPVPAAETSPADRPKSNPEPWLSGDFWGATPAQPEEPQAVKTESVPVEPAAPAIPSIPDPAVTLEFVPSAPVAPVSAAYPPAPEPVPLARTEVDGTAPSEATTPEVSESEHSATVAEIVPDEGDSRPETPRRRRAASPRRRTQKTDEGAGSQAAETVATVPKEDGDAGTEGAALTPTPSQRGEGEIGEEVLAGSESVRAPRPHRRSPKAEDELTVASDGR